MNNPINNLTNNPTNILPDNATNNTINNPTKNVTNNPTNILNSGLSHTPTSQSLNHQHQVSNYGKILTAQHNQECTTNTGGKNITLSNGHTPSSRIIREKKDDSRYKIKQISFLNINVRGVKSKLDSLESLLISNDIDIAGITETRLNGNEQIYVDGYQWYGHSREEKGGGGVGFLIKNELTSLIEDTSVGTLDELKWINLKAKQNIYIGIYYGPQENIDKELVEEQYCRIAYDINQKQKRNNIILMGDFNAKLQIEKDSCLQQTSRNGKLLQELINHTDMTVVNQLPKHEGTWTRIHTQNNNQKSIIDYIMTSPNVNYSIINSSTDSDGYFQIKGKNQTDHQCMFLTLSLTTKPRIVTTKKWRIGKPEQWEDYNSHYNESTRNKTPTNATDLTKLIIQSLHKAIGKTTIKAGKPMKITNQEIKEARSNRKTQKMIFTKSLKAKKPDQIEKAKNSYIQSQQKLRELVEKNIAEDTKQ